MLSFGKESIISSTSTIDQDDSGKRMKIEAETCADQGGVADNFSREVQAPISPNQSQVEDDYSIARDRPRR